MTIEEHAATFAGRPVELYDPETGVAAGSPGVYRLALEYGSATPFPELLDRFLSEPSAPPVTALVVGAWDFERRGDAAAAEVIEALAAAHDRMPQLRALFLGDIIREEFEISWIRLGDVSPLLAAYPLLEEFRVRGGEGLTFGRLSHANLRSLTVESGGLAEGVLREIWAADLPRLERLELWLGTDEYGGIIDAGPLGPLLSGKLFPNLTHLGLRDAEIADAVATAVARSPLLARLRVLDLSLGNLADDGARALLLGLAAATKRPERLDIHHHYASAPVVKELSALGIDVDATEPQTPDEHGGETYRYIAVSE